jgi:hypothetical protein
MSAQAEEQMLFISTCSCHEKRIAMPTLERSGIMRGLRHTSTSRLMPMSCWGVLIVCLIASTAQARNPIRSDFFDEYPNAVGTAIETVPSQPNHCGMCHYEFTGGGPRNPYGARLEAELPNHKKAYQAIQAIENEDSDGDGFSTLTEVTDVTTFTNTPTFPGLTPANIGSVTSVDVAEIQLHLVPSTGSDTTPPDVTVIAPDGGETLVANDPTTVEWIAGDASGIAAIDLYVSLDNGVTFKPVAQNLHGSTTTHTWFPANRPTVEAIFRVAATDNAFNEGHDDSDAVFTIESPLGGNAPTTLRDFDQPGSQPFEAGTLNPPEACAPCHGGYDNAVEPYYNWQGSMMAQASRDLLFEANMAIANQDAPDSGDLCLRCHLPRGWLQGRSVPTDGSQMLSTDKMGVSCDFCHRLVDPIADPQNPAEDTAILAALSFPGTEFGNGMAVIDPTGGRRGPFSDTVADHPVLVSPFHREAALCGTCHDVSNPAFETDGNGNYVPNDFNAPATNFSAHVLAPVERTYSEWFYSDYNTPGGVFAPQFGGNLDYVSTCQDCHMRDVTGEGCNNPAVPTRSDMPLHDITGGSTWLPSLLSTLYPPDEVNDAALQAGIARARHMLQNAADLAAVQEGNQLKVTVTNNTGHKLPTGYPEGRRMWINVRFLDESSQLIEESGAYNAETGELSHGEGDKIYEVKPGLDSITAPLVGKPEGPSFHFVLNNTVYKDNRIPPQGFTNAAYADFGGAPVDYSYADLQYWDDTFYTIPPGAASADVTLYYQSTSKEFVEFLRDENFTNTKGDELYNLWNTNNKCPPEQMATTSVTIEPTAVPVIVSAQSVKVNAFDETFGVDMKLAGSADPLLVEPRADGPTRMVFTFNEDVDITGAVVTLSVAWGSYTPTLDGVVAVGTDGMEVQASGISTADLYTYCVKVDISGVVSSPGGVAMDPVRYLILPLLGDVNGDGWTDAADINLAKAQSGEYVWGTTGADFRRDFNLDGWVDSGDINLAKGESGNSCYCDE